MGYSWNLPGRRARPRLDIVARWVVEPALVCAPERIDFGTVRTGSRQAQTVRIESLFLHTLKSVWAEAARGSE